MLLLDRGLNGAGNNFTSNSNDVINNFVIVSTVIDVLAKSRSTAYL